MRTVVSRRGPPWQLAAALSTFVVIWLILALVVVGKVTLPFMLAVGAVLGVQMVVFAHANRRAVEEAGDQQFTSATGITTVRSAAVVILAGFLTVSKPEGAFAWLPALLFGVASLFDGLDGAVARAMDSVTAFGSRVDVEMDSLALLVGILVAIGYGLAPVFYLAVGIARYAFVGGIALRRRRNLPIGDLATHPVRKSLGALQMLVVFLILSPPLGTTVSWYLATVAMIPTLVWFGRDWLIVSHRL